MKPEIELQYHESNEWVETATLIAIKLHLGSETIRIKFEGEGVAISVDSNLIIYPVAANAIRIRMDTRRERDEP